MTANTVKRKCRNTTTKLNSHTDYTSVLKVIYSFKSIR